MLIESIKKRKLGFKHSLGRSKIKRSINPYFKIFYRLLKPDYRNTPLKIPWASISSPPGLAPKLAQVGY
jgi:hypothetical protein